MLDFDDLHDYQLDAIAAMEDTNEAIVWCGLGGGKTAIALTLIARLGLNAVVFSTKRIIEYVWPAEIEKWEHLKGLTYRACSGTPKQRFKAIEEAPQILGVSFDNLKWYTEQPDPFCRPIVVFDEISKMKATGTQRFKAWKKAREQYIHLYGLTATPATESYLGLFGQYKAIVTEPILGRTLTQFRKTYTTPIFKGMFTDYQVGPLQKRAIEAAIAPYTIIVKDELKRPEPTVIDVPVPWRKQNESLYRDMEKKFVLELEEHGLIHAPSAGAARMKCRTLASGFLYHENQAIPTDPSKLDAIVEGVEALGGEPVLIAYQFLAEKEALLRTIPGAEPLEGDAYQRFDRGEIPALVVHPKSCGHGLNLQGACRHVFWSSLPESLEDYLQTNGRIDRQGQKKQVVIKRFVREKSIDTDILVPQLAGKEINMVELIQRMRGRG